MIEKRTLILTILYCHTILCAQLPSSRQIDLTSAEIDPNVSPLNNNNRPSSSNKPINNNNNNNIDESVITTTPATIFTTISPLNDDIPNNTILDSNPSSGSITTSSQRPPIIIPIAPNIDDQKPIDKFCKCTETLCNCCRDFSLPLIPIRGPGCAKIQYLGEEKMSVQIKYGDIVLASRIINGKKSAPVCVGLPGGYNRFCARFYGLSKEKSGFKSCMSLELRAEDDVEAQLRVSCFKFGRKGFSVTEAEPIPQIENEKDDEDDDDDFFGLGGGGDDDDDDDTADDDDDDDDDDEPAGAAAGTDDSTDYDFRFIEEIFDTDDNDKNDKNDKIISVTQRATIISPSSNNIPQTKENSMNNDDNIINNNNNSNNTTINDESGIVVPSKKVKKNKKKKKHDEDGFDMADIIYGILNLF